MILVAVSLIALAIYQFLPPVDSRVLNRRWNAQPRSVSFPRWHSSLIDLCAPAIIIGAVLIWMPKQFITILSVCIPLATAWWWVHNYRQCRQQMARQQQVAQMAMGLSALLASGQLPLQALEILAPDFPLIAPAAACQRIGGDVAEAFARQSKLSGAEGLAELARTWRLAEQTGAPIAVMMEKIAEQLRQHAETMRVVHRELASSKATGIVFVFLPLLGLAMGYASGAQPMKFLTSFAGRILVLVAVSLASCGFVWMNLLAHPRRFLVTSSSRKTM